MRARRSGIANLVGAVFFILIVVLMVGALATMFNTFSGAVGGQHTSNQATQLAQQQALSVQNLTFGGLTSTAGFSYSQNGAVTLNPNVQQLPILPIVNMNFTGNMQGWSTSRSYTKVAENATIQTSPQLVTYTDIFFPPQPETFTLVVTNNDPIGLGPNIAKVSLLVDSTWSVPSPQPLTLNWGATSGSSSVPNVVGNNITWVSTGLFGIAPNGGSQTFSWTATVQPQTSATYYQTVVVSWLSNNMLPYTDTAIATTNITISHSNIPSMSGVSTALVNPALPGSASSGVSAGYDANALQTSSESGPGSMYVDYKPSFNSVPIVDGQQLTSTVNFTTAFSLDTNTSSYIDAGKCCTVTWASSFDSVNAPRDSLVLYQAYLTNPNGLSFELPVGGISCGPSPTVPPIDYVNPTVYNDFAASSWVFSHVCFNPGTFLPLWFKPLSSLWYPGIYTFKVVVTMTVPGAFPQTIGYPPEVSIHLDDIGLALKPLATTYYGSTTFQIPTGLNINQVQGLELGINATGAPQNTTIYAYVADNSRFVYNPILWVQVGSASFSNAGTIDSVSPLPNAAYYLNTTAHLQGGKPEIGDLVVRVNATSSVPTLNPYQVKLAVYAVIQTFNQTRVVVELKNLSQAPIKLLSMVITGPGTALTSNFAANFYFSQGQKVVLPETFVWIPGQIYTVTVTTAAGLTFSRSFTAPLA